MVEVGLSPEEPRTPRTDSTGISGTVSMPWIDSHRPPHLVCTPLYFCISTMFLLYRSRMNLGKWISSHKNPWQCIPSRVLDPGKTLGALPRCHAHSKARDRQTRRKSISTTTQHNAGLVRSPFHTQKAKGHLPFYIATSIRWTLARIPEG